MQLYNFLHWLHGHLCYYEHEEQDLALLIRWDRKAKMVMEEKYSLCSRILNYDSNKRKGQPN